MDATNQELKCFNFSIAFTKLENEEVWKNKNSVMFSTNVYLSKDYTYYNLKRLMNDQNMTIVKGDKRLMNRE